MTSIQGRDYLYRERISEALFWPSISIRLDYKSIVSPIIDHGIGFVRFLIAKYIEKDL